MAEKFMAVLQDPAAMDANAAQFAFVLCSTDRSAGRGPRAFEVLLGTRDGFHHATMVDGRWVYTLPRFELDEDEFRFTLTEERMDEVSVAVFIGLQLSP